MLVIYPDTSWYFGKSCPVSFLYLWCLTHVLTSLWVHWHIQLAGLYLERRPVVAGIDCRHSSTGALRLCIVQLYTAGVIVGRETGVIYCRHLQFKHSMLGSVLLALQLVNTIQTQHAGISSAGSPACQHNSNTACWGQFCWLSSLSTQFKHSMLGSVLLTLQLVNTLSQLLPRKTVKFQKKTITHSNVLLLI